MLRRLHVEFAVVGDGRAEATAIEFRVLEDFRLVTRLDDVKRTTAAGFAAVARTLASGVVEHRHVKLAVGVEWAGVALLDAEFEFPFDRAGVRIHGAEIAFFSDDINRVTDEDRGTGRGGNIRGPELKFFAFEHQRAGR